jgi:predicted signal transduction protein with EAL and GGDEF domain
MEEGIIALSNTDHLTGLHNRRGFITLAEQQLKMQEHTRNLIMLLYADLDRMKWINDTLGRGFIEDSDIINASETGEDLASFLGRRMGRRGPLRPRTERSLLIPTTRTSPKDFACSR